MTDANKLVKEPSQDWQDFPEEFHNLVDPFVEPTAWVPLRAS